MRTLDRALALMLIGLAQAAFGATLQPYRDEAELAGALERWRAAAQKLLGSNLRLQEGSLPVPAAPGAMPSYSQSVGASAKTQSESAAAPRLADSITNVQTQGVDEGGIVKQAGDHLVILRRGRLFTVRTGGDELRPVATIDAYAPGSDPRGAWYDELLVSGSTVVVIGYSYSRGGTEIVLFELGADGGLAYRATYHLRSADYYSSRNYASRLLGNRLVFYTPTLLQPWGPRPSARFPAQRRWGGPQPGELPQAFERILPPTRVFRTDDDFDPAEALALHTVTTCELGGASLRCEATAVLAPAGRVFYVSAGSVYVWTTVAGRWQRGLRPAGGESRSALFRLPLDGAAPSAIKTSGVPLDSMSFLEDRQGFINVLLSATGRGEGTWDAERSQGRMALLRLPLAALGDGRAAAERSAYRRVPGPASGPLQNRYVGDWLLWGGAQGAWALRYAQGGVEQVLEPGHAVERIEALGEHALLVGSAGAELSFSAVQLRRNSAKLAGRFNLPNARQGETRTHGFFYRPSDVDAGLLGLPVLPSHGDDGLRGAGASVLFLRQRDLEFTGLGELASQVGANMDDACKASCVDWYGNARPIFLGQRVLALIGYELVEGRLASRGGREQIDEVRRVSFAPQARVPQRSRPTPFD